MLPADAKIISIDDHVIEHPRVWLDRLPATRKVLAESLADVPDEDARKIAELNARKLYRFPA